MKNLLTAILLTLAVGAARADEKVTYDDQVVSVFRGNCFKCHNPDKAKGDLDLTTFTAVLKGGGSGKVVVPGDPSASKLFKSVTHAEEPYMPDKSPKMADADIDVVRRWIAGGLLEKSTSKALAGSGPKVDLTLRNVGKGKPDGPPPMPVDWLLEPVVHTEHTSVETALASSPWAPVIALGGQHQVLLYQSDTSELLGVLPFPEGFPSSLQFSRNGKLLVVGGGRGAKLGHVVIADLTTGERIITVGDEYDTVLASDLRSDQSQVALGGPTKHVKIYATRDGQLLHDIKKHTDWVTAIEYSPDGVLLASGDRNGGLMIWEADTGQEFYTLTGHKSAITSVDWRDDSDVLLSASEDGTVRLWEMREGREVKNWTAHKEGILSARFTHDGRVVTCGRDNQIAIWDANGNKQRSFEFGGELPVRVTFSHDGSNVVATAWSGKVGVWNAADGKPRGELQSDPAPLADRLKAAEAKVAATTNQVELAAIKAAIAQLKLAQVNATVYHAREEFAAKQRDHAKLVAAVADAQDDNAKAISDLAASRKALEASPAKIKDLEAAVAKLKPPATATKDELKIAQDKLKKAQAELKAAQAEPAELAKRIDLLTKLVPVTAAKIVSAKAAAESSAQRLAGEKLRVEKLAADYQRQKSPTPEATKEAKR